MLKCTTESTPDAALELLNNHDAHAVLLVPTETVYGLVCDWNDAAARDKIYAMKKRPQEKLLTAFVPDSESLRDYVPGLPETARKFAAEFCPGPITIIVPDAAGGTFGFRIPDHPFILALLKKYGKALASTSANRSGEPAALSVEEALRSLAFEPDIAVDGGVIDAASKASTIVQVFADNTWKILREGPVSFQELQSAASCG